MLFSVRIDYPTGLSDEWVNVRKWRFTKGRLQILGQGPRPFSGQWIVHEIDASSVLSIRVTKWGETPVNANP